MDSRVKFTNMVEPRAPLTNRDKPENSKNTLIKHKSSEKRSKMIIYGSFDDVMSKKNQSSFDDNNSIETSVY